MVKKTDKSLKRREELLKILRNSGFATMPRLHELGERFGVSAVQIHKDLKAIRKDIPPEDAYLIGLKYSRFIQESVDDLKRDLKNCKNIRDKTKLILSINQLLKDEILVRQKLGLVEKPVEKVDTTLKIKWEG